MKDIFSKFKINSKKDWIIFWIFAALIAYAVAYNYDKKITCWLRSIGNPWLWEGNEPQSYGRMIIAGIMLTILAEAVCFLRRKKLRMKLAVLAGGLLLPVLLTGMYLINCRLIVSVIWQEEPDAMTVWWDENEYTIRYTPSEEEQLLLLEYYRNMTVVSDKHVQEEFMQWYWDTEGKDIWSATQVDLHFPKKYGHSCWFKVQVWGDYLYFFRGNGAGGNNILITLFEDNGLIAYLEELQQKHAKR